MAGTRLIVERRAQAELLDRPCAVMRRALRAVREILEFRPPADRVLKGDIVCRGWVVDSAKDATG